REEDFTVTFTEKCIAFLHQFLPDRAETVDLSVAYKIIAVQSEGLQPFLGQAHDGQTLKSHQSASRIDDLGGVRAAGDRRSESLQKTAVICFWRTITHDRTHKSYPSFCLLCNKKGTSDI